ncbi:xylose isomerase [Bacillus sp. SA1-12]|uniref:sugar phosphate isomerase/epimerase family protein n=1 Tax=Bacillus sp. SA1-12 TaxID=1455638 RepID=UPI0006270E57|nr:sugar phosphate isomerase/epimerase family protein [Bacillus sp. SA1-12]KKI90244.1 xylose isomerase [Bacillus sp. SA1-12]
MKLAFTTLGCPQWDLETIISQAVKNGYDGVDFRGYLGELEIYHLPEFSSDVKETVRKFREASLEISCFSSSVRIFTTSKNELDHFSHEINRYALLCKEFNTPYIRVFGGSIGETNRHEAIEIAVRNVTEMLKIAERHQVELLLETHDDWTKCEYVEAVMKRVQSDHLHVLWDVHHPYRTEGEDPSYTWGTIGKWVKYTHWKDSYLKSNTKRGYQLCLLGEGDLPLQQIANLLKTEGYDGYLTLEWEKMWCPEIEEPEIAFRQYIGFMKRLLNTK